MKTCTRKPTPPFIQTTTTALNALARVNKSFDADHIAKITEEADAVALVAERFYGINVDFSEQLSKINVDKPRKFSEWVLGQKRPADWAEEK
jgi:predicted RNase H-like nuclease (RuvC/YqgF family)